MESVDETFAMSGFSLLDESDVVDIADTIESVIAIVQNVGHGEERRQLKVCEGALKHVLEVLRPELDSY